MAMLRQSQQNAGLGEIYKAVILLLTNNTHPQQLFPLTGILNLFLQSWGLNPGSCTQNEQVPYH